LPLILLLRGISVYTSDWIGWRWRLGLSMAMLIAGAAAFGLVGADWASVAILLPLAAPRSAPSGTWHVSVRVLLLQNLPALAIASWLTVDIVATGSIQDQARAVAFGFVVATGLVHALVFARRSDRSASDGVAVGFVVWIAASTAGGSLDRIGLDGFERAAVAVMLAFVGLDIITTLVREMREDTRIWSLIIAAVMAAVLVATSSDAGPVRIAVLATAFVAIPLGWRVKRIARREEDADL
jgi:hypothetical protein